MEKLYFSGHESFICKHFWLKKAFDFVNGNKHFNDDNAVVDLGVGKNMVSSIRFWGKSFGVLSNDSDEPTFMADFIFGKNGKDPFLEDIGTIWLLQYWLVKIRRASIYNIVFNEFRKERIEFNKDQLHLFLKRKCEDSKTPYNPNTINSDINVFLRNYLKPHKDESVEIEDDFSGILMDLNLVSSFKQRIDGKITQWYKIEGQERMDLPFQIVLFSILDNFVDHNTVTFRELQIGLNSPGMAFALSSDGLYNQIQKICSNYNDVVFSETAGNQILQFKSKLDPYQVLNEYYQ